MRALDIASTGMAAQQTRVETISNNLANMSTTAYNARRAEFADLHYQQVRQPVTGQEADFHAKKRHRLAAPARGQHLGTG